MQEKALQLVSLAQAKKLKELGFDWGTYYYYNIKNKLRMGPTNYYNDDEKPAPTISLALKWFRDVKGVRIALIVSGMMVVLRLLT